MRSTLNLFLFSFALSGALNLVGQTPTLTTIDYPGSSLTIPWAINNRGDIVGNYGSADKSNHGFLLSAGKYTTIDFPGSNNTQAYGINAAGDISGLFVSADNISHGFVYKAGQFTSLDFPGAVATDAWGINTRGDVVGSYTNADKTTHGYVFSAGKYTTIDYPETTFSGLSGINAQGDVTGVFNIGGVVHGFTFVDGEYTILDFPASTYTNTTGINARGDVLGRYLIGGVSHGYLLRGGQFSIIDFPGATFNGLTSINQRGDILGRYRNADGIFHGFLLLGFQPACIVAVPRVVSTPGGVAITHSSDFTLVTAAKPAAAGEVLSLFATGLGATRPSVNPGQPFPSNPPAAVASAVEVRVNGKPAELFGAVGFPGALDGYQVNFRVPTDAVKGLAAIQVTSALAIGAPVSIMIQ